MGADEAPKRFGVLGEPRNELILAHQSVRNFARVFTADVGTTPAKYVLHLRVEAARRLLQSSSHDLRRIATATGFGSVDGMRRAFVRVLGKSPREMRTPN